MFTAIVWLAYVPKSSKTKFWAKVFRQDILMLATDAGNLLFYRGHTEGPGVFRSHDGVRIDFIPRGPENWINKSFHADKMAHFIGYAGKALATNFEALAVLTAHQSLQTYRNGLKENKKKLNAMLKHLRSNPQYKGKTELEMIDVYRDFIKTNPEAKLLYEQLKEAQVNVTKTKTVKSENGEKKTKKKIKRMVAMLLDPRIIQTYFTNTVQPSQARHVHDVGYRQGYRDGSNPMAKFKLVFVALIIIIPVVAILALLLLGGGGSA